MKKIIVILVVFIMSLPVMAMDKNSMKNMISKIRKNNSNVARVVIVAGVRGADVQKQDVMELKRSLYWED